MRRIKTAYDAYWFLHDHPKFNRIERGPVESDKLKEARKDARKRKSIVGKPVKTRLRFVKDGGGNWWREWLDLTVPALDENLDIHYAKVDERGRVNKEAKKNVSVECWLEFGPVEYGYHQPEYEIKEGARSYKMHFHDVDLDCGGKTFDEALIKLARKALKKYGDYPKQDWA